MAEFYYEAQDLAVRLGSRNPYALLDYICAVLRIVYEFDQNGLKGFVTIMNDVSYVVINGNLPELEKKIVAGHEAAHLVLHKKEILLSGAGTFKDFGLYDNSGKMEFEANSFLSDFLVSDEQVMEIILSTNTDFYSAAKQLELPPPLFSFKLYSMTRRGFKFKNPAPLKSGFLGGDYIW